MVNTEVCLKPQNFNNIALKVNGLLISVVVYSLQCKIEGYAVLKSGLILHRFFVGRNLKKWHC